MSGLIPSFQAYLNVTTSGVASSWAFQVLDTTGSLLASDAAPISRQFTVASNETNEGLLRVSLPDLNDLVGATGLINVQVMNATDETLFISDTFQIIITETNVPIRPGVWAPLGPFADRVLIPVYDGASAELSALAEGEVDLVDTDLTPEWTGTLCSDAKIACESYELGVKAYNAHYTGIVNEVDYGADSWLSRLGMHPPDGSPMSQILASDLNGNGVFDGGEPFTVRWGFSNSTPSLNPLVSTLGSEWKVLNLVHDSLTLYNPLSPYEEWSSMASSVTKLPATAGALGYVPPLDTAVVYRFFLKNHLGWHDGSGVTPRDVALSILAHSDVDFSDLSAATDLIGYVRVVSEPPQAGVIDVGSLWENEFALRGIGMLPVIPCRVYDADNCFDIPLGVTLPNAAGPGSLDYVDGPAKFSGFDPVFIPDEDADGMPESDCDDLGSHRTGLAGSGPFVLECTSTGDGEVGPGGIILLRAFVVPKSQFAKSREYWASPHNYLVWRWADFNNNGVVDTSDKARTRLNPPIGCRNKPVPVDQTQWDANQDGEPDDVCIQFDFNRNGVAADFNDRARITLEGAKQWTPSFSWPYPEPYPWTAWVWWLSHQCNGPDRIKNTADDDKNACWFTKFASRPP